MKNRIRFTPELLSVNGPDGTTCSPKVGMRVWLREFSGVAKAFVGAAGTITGVGSHGRVKVTLDRDNAICRTHNLAGFEVVPAALMVVNPFANLTTTSAGTDELPSTQKVELPKVAPRKVGAASLADILGTR